MRKSVVIIAVALVSATFLGISQNLPKVVADIPFSFMAGEKTLPAGSYQFKEGNTPKQITIRDNKTNESIIVLVLTRISASSGKEVEIVFDKVGTEHYLSEIQMPGVDGYVFKGASDAHAHTSIRAKQ